MPTKVLTFSPTFTINHHQLMGKKEKSKKLRKVQPKKNLKESLTPSPKQKNHFSTKK